MSPPPGLAERIAVATEIARGAGAIVQQHYGKLSGYEEKAKNDLVSVADKESEAFIAAALARAFPQDLTAMEEADGVAGARAKRAQIEAAPFTWCIDPLDGTTSFVHSYPVFGVSIGLLAHGRPVGGVVYAPARDETYVGGEGLGARFWASTAGAPRALSVSKVPSLDRALIGTGFSRGSSEGNEETLAIVREVLSTAHDIRRAGAAALDLCDVAAGRIDGFFQRGLAPWDLAAGQAIVEAAGGRLSTYALEPHGPYAPSVVATNSLIHDALGAAIGRARATLKGQS
ncbi:MAG: inositol monophosphatase family protein [Myxococcota bacterium]